MQTLKFRWTLRAASAVLLALAFAGCTRTVTDEAPVPETPVPAQSAPTIPDAPPPGETAPTPDAMPAPAVAATAASSEPSVDTMFTAVPSAKMGVAVDLRYSFEGPVVANQPVVVHLAALPRVGGASLKVSVQESPGMQISSGPIIAQKADASGVYRQQFALTKLSGMTDTLSVLVIMESGEESAFGYFTIPLGTVPAGGTNPQKQDSVKQR